VDLSNLIHHRFSDDSKIVCTADTPNPTLWKFIDHWSQDTMFACAQNMFPKIKMNFCFTANHHMVSQNETVRPETHDFFSVGPACNMRPDL
jgi:hypothetical protein